MKNKTISIRLSEEEYSILNTILEKNNMTASNCIREFIHGVKPKESHNQEVAKIMAQIYIRLGELGMEDEKLMEEVQALCQSLS